MSSRSMNYLRKHSKVIIVIMGIVCMITFVIGAALSDMAQRSSQRAQHPNPVVVTWAKGKVRSDDLSDLQYRHSRVYAFLYQVIAEALNRGGKPMVNGQPVTPDRMGMFNVGIPRDNTEWSTVQTMVLAAEADRMGVAVDSQAAKQYLAQISSPELKEGDWYEIATELLKNDSNRLSVNQLLEHLAYELKAQHVRMLAMSGYYAQGVGPIVPPGQAYDLFCRLNRRLAIEAYPVETADFVSQVKGAPSEAEIQDLFDEGKGRNPNPNMDEPGFRKPHKLAFKWLKVNFTPFLDEAKKQITEEQIEEAYQKDIGQGLHKVQELPTEKAPDAGTNNDAEKPADPKSDDSKPADAKPADESKEEPKPSPETPAATPEAEKPAAPQPEATKSEEKPEAKPEGEGDCGQDTQPQQPSTSEPKPDAVKTNAAPASNGQAKSETSSDEKPADEKPADSKTGDVKLAENKQSADAAAKPADSEAEKPATAPPRDPAAATPAAEVKYKPLSEVRDQILTRLAQPIAEDARKKAVAEVVSTIDKYGKAYRKYVDVKSIRKNADIKEPQKLDILPLATKQGFEIGESPLVDQFEIEKYEIGQKVQQFDMAAAQMGQLRMLSFADLAYGQDVPLYRAEEARSSEPDVSYVYFRTAEEKAADVTLKEAREQIVAFWKQRQAFDLAMAEAKKLAEKAKGAGSLASAVPEAAKVVTTPPFSWMTSGGFGFGQPELSQVPGVDLAGREFMQSVFSLSPGETGAAPNQSHAKVYVVRVLSQDPEEERLRSQFLESGYNQMVLMLAQGEALETSVAWYKAVADRYAVKWERAPQDERRM